MHKRYMSRFEDHFLKYFSQKVTFANVLQNNYSKKFPNIHAEAVVRRCSLK